MTNELTQSEQEALDFFHEQQYRAANPLPEMFIEDGKAANLFEPTTEETYEEFEQRASQLVNQMYMDNSALRPVPNNHIFRTAETLLTAEGFV